VIDPDAPIPYVLTDLGRREVAQLAEQEAEGDCPGHEWKQERRGGLICQNCGRSSTLREDIPDYLAPRKWRPYR
jgi:uncharacterized protein YbaR (Trm112 family)